MQPIICEICGSNDIVKQDGVFVCQHCGTKYSADEVRKFAQKKEELLKRM
ncbi:MAG: TFIIB-type zinc finger domain-containing protein [Clostridia bacterium]|nr:TFIIB-type zinc finger domain-containing protein [Clostridia bacterium]